MHAISYIDCQSAANEHPIAEPKCRTYYQPDRIGESYWHTQQQQDGVFHAIRKPNAVGESVGIPEPAADDVSAINSLCDAVCIAACDHYSAPVPYIYPDFERICERKLLRYAQHLCDGEWYCLAQPINDAKRLADDIPDEFENAFGDV